MQLRKANRGRCCIVDVVAENGIARVFLYFRLPFQFFKLQLCEEENAHGDVSAVEDNVSKVAELHQ